MKCMSPVGKQLVGDETTRDLSDNVTPEEGAVDQPHCLRVPVKLSFLERENKRDARLNLETAFIWHNLPGCITDRLIKMVKTAI